ncbi:MAG: Transporter [candidate division Zixibacteria bacterium RBG-1]|nr:MAG: Transporter [candidate division Zixibacteria bacterium RBG-1]OGC86341.1 MAG: transporter [candidate division Zixibacteria bacterium RBG_19FT_COMBO_42_43]
MPLFKIDGSAVKKITIKEVDLEKNLQELFENNLEEILNISYLAHEYSTSFGGRIDTLGIDRNGSPCIIEYKKNQNDNVINQGLSYLRWLLDHKADFEILCQSKKIDIEIDWDSPRVICIAESYNKFDLDTADILPINIELLRYRIYDENILYVEPDNYQKTRVSSSGITEKAKQKKERQEKLQKTYSVDDHLKKPDEKIKALFQKLREKIISIDEDIKEEPKKLYIAYKLATNFVDIEVRRMDIKIYLNVRSGQLNDPQNIARDLTKPKPIGHWGNGDYEVKLENQSGLDSVFALIKQSYDLNK